MGEAALLVDFASEPSDEAHRRVLALDAQLARAPLPGVLETVPAPVTLLVCFDPEETDVEALEAFLLEHAERPSSGGTRAREHVIPICYAPPFAPDMDAVAERLARPREAVAALHASVPYTVTMYGFAPGYAYLGGIPEGLRMPRKAQPERGHPVGSVMIAASQCLITTLAMPTGWWVIGRTPTQVLEPQAEEPFLFAPGDTVRFRAIDASEFARLAAG